MKNIIAFVGGILLGAVTTYFTVKKSIKTSCEKECQKEIDDYKKFVKEKVLKGGSIESHKRAVEELKKTKEDTKTRNSFIEHDDVKKKRHNVTKKETTQCDEKRNDTTIRYSSSPIEIDEEEKDLYVDVEGYTEMSLRYDIMNDILMTVAGDMIVDWDEIDKGLVEIHEAGEDVYILNESIETVFSIRIFGDDIGV